MKNFVAHPAAISARSRNLPMRSQNRVSLPVTGKKLEPQAAGKCATAPGVQTVERRLTASWKIEPYAGEQRDGEAFLRSLVGSRAIRLGVILKKTEAATAGKQRLCATLKRGAEKLDEVMDEIEAIGAGRSQSAQVSLRLRARRLGFAKWHLKTEDFGRKMKDEADEADEADDA